MYNFLLVVLATYLTNFPSSICRICNGLTIPFFSLFCISGDDHLDSARAYYGVGCALGALGSTDEALENLDKARDVQVRFLASRQDIDKTEQEINRLRGKARPESPCRMLQQMFIQNCDVTGQSVVTLTT